MTTVQRFTAICLLLAGLAGRAADNDLQANLIRASELQTQLVQQLGLGDKGDKAKLNEAIQSLAALKAPLCEGFKVYLPPAGSEYGKLFGPCNFGDGSFRYVLKDAHQRRLATVQVFYHPNGVQPADRGMFAKCLDYPATRVLNRRVGVLVNKVEIHISAVDKEFQSDAKLDALIAAFDLAGLAKL